MKFGDYTDRGLDQQPIDRYPWNEHKLNRMGYRCHEWDPMPDGKKNVKNFKPCLKSAINVTPINIIAASVKVTAICDVKV